MAESARRFGWRTGGDAGREMLIGAALAVAVLYVENSARDRVPALRDIIRNSILGAK